jgi:hypothetical protein
MNKKYFLYAILPVLALVSVGGAAYAFSGVNNGQGNSEIISAIAEKFNLNQSDVQAVFDEHRAIVETYQEQNRIEMQGKMQEKFQERINQAVATAKLTQEQANKILAKNAELVSQKTDLQDKTREEMQTIMKEQMDSLKQWAEDNNIPLQYMQFGGAGFGRGMGMRGFGCNNLDK